MKNIILFFAIVLNCLMASAQTSKGSIMVGGNFNVIGWKTSRTDLFNNPDNLTSEFKYTSIGFFPNIGYFIKDKLAVGISAGLNNTQEIHKYSDNNSFSEDIYKSNNVTFNIFAKKYFLNEKNFGFYTGLSVGSGPSKGSITYHKSNSTEPYTTSKSTSVNVGLNFGLAYFPTPKIGLQAGVAGFGWSKNKGKTVYDKTGEESKYNSSTFNFNMNSLVFSLGVYYIFGFKNKQP